MSGAGDLLDSLQDRARELLRGAADAVDLDNLRSALEQVEHGGDGSPRISATVTTAVSLTDSERETLESRLRAKHGKDVPSASRVDPSIRGGVIVRVGDRYVDGSVVARLGQLRQELTGSGAR